MKGKFLFCLTLLIFSLNSFLFAKDKNQEQNKTEEELSLFEIDKLIRKTEYDEALKQLNVYIDKNPEHFDNAQARIGKIMNAKIKYSELAEELIETIRNDPTNNKKIYEITAQLEKFERHPSDQNLQFIADAKKSAEFNYFRAQFLEIQNGVAENVKNRNYVAAVQKAQEGFWLYKDAFYIKWEDSPEIISSVEKLVNDLNSHLAEYEERSFIYDINRNVSEFIKAVNQDQYDLAVRRFKGVRTSLTKYNDLRIDIKNDMAKMEKKVADLQKIDPDMTDASYLPFLIHFISGSEAIEGSGILGAVDGQWNDFLGQMNNAVFAMITEKYNLFESGITDEYAENIGKYVSLQRNVHSLYDIPNKKNVEIKNPYLDYLMLSEYAFNISDSSYKVLVMLDEVNKNKIVQEKTIADFKAAESLKTKNDIINQLMKYSTDLEKIGGSRADLILENQKWAKEYLASDYKNWNELSKKYSSVVDDIFNSKQKIAEKSWNEISDFYVVKAEELYNQLVLYTNVAEKYKSGIIGKLSPTALKEIDKDITRAIYYNEKISNNKELDLGILYSYPDISMELVSYILKEIDNKVEEINDYDKLLSTSVQSQEIWNKNKKIAGDLVKVKEELNKQKDNILGLRNRVKNINNSARNMIVAAEKAKNEADVRFKEAERAMKNEDFTTARKKLENALSKYDEALRNQNNEELRVQWDNKLQKLGEQIAKNENEVIVRQVRELKVAAKDAYFNGRFDDAEKYLNQASVKWAITNVTEDPEITNLMNFVNTAISMKTGREILPSAPQYPEMSQLLNIAHQSFDEGSSLLKKGMVEDANKQFDIALDSIQKVQYVYPLNQEAALLTLQINRIKDPKKFKEEFAQKIKSAEMLCKTPDTQQEGYANLLDYYQLEPNYPGLKELIYQVEIDIGIRQKPVDNSGKNKARRYIADAQNIYNKAGNDLEQLNRALNKVNQALVLVPDDSAAMKLKDKITTKMGGTASTVLSTEDERLYQLAIQRLQNNNVVGANAIVDELLKKPQNRYSQKIKDLKNKIDARS